ncbi:hypothetical protein K470DRAFT_262488 [Piedraia hortae CBS 480.64]|uniref:Uncharacterized protein n=1 Tax=Piedraia hortae CBS 480.64 TaxID=1314780 RepID=A0A6A7C8P7_9PEZI|nr:hypothetical protein K470DRAFT_262488 [Piedraia hortae CBS 480.64]
MPCSNNNLTGTNHGQEFAHKGSSIVSQAGSSPVNIKYSDVDSNYSATSYFPHDSIDEDESFYYPAPPANTPRTRSEAEDRARMVDSKLLSMNLRGLDKSVYISGETNSESSSTADPLVHRGSKSSFPEFSNWAGLAEEDLTNALKGIARLAEDLHKENPSKSVAAYYSDEVSRILKVGSIKFTPMGFVSSES